MERDRELLLVALARGLDGEAEHRLRELQRREVDLVLVVAVVQYGVEMQFVDFRHRGDVARDGVCLLYTSYCTFPALNVIIPRYLSTL